MTSTGTVATGGGFLLVVLLVPIVKKLCVHWRLYDWPGPLKLHTKPIPRLGGIAIALALAGGVLLAVPSAEIGELLLVAAMALICTVGAIDDVRGLSAGLRLAVQVVAGAMLWFACGRPVVLESSTLGLFGSCLLVVAIVNSFNFLDGADGLAAGVAGIIGATYALLPWPAGHRLAPALAWSLAGVCLGFLFSNSPPATIFAGDSGSTALGLAVAFLSLSFYRSPMAAGPRLLFPFVAAALPLLDLALTVIRRIRGRASPFFGDRRHFYDLMRARGASPHAVALACYGVTGLFGLIGLVGMRAKASDFVIPATVGVGALLTAAIRMGALRLDGERTQQSEKGLAEISR